MKSTKKLHFLTQPDYSTKIKAVPACGVKFSSVAKINDKVELKQIAPCYYDIPNQKNSKNNYLKLNITYYFYDKNGKDKNGVISFKDRRYFWNKAAQCGLLKKELFVFSSKSFEKRSVSLGYKLLKSKYTYIDIKNEKLSPSLLYIQLCLLRDPAEHAQFTQLVVDLMRKKRLHFIIAYHVARCNFRVNGHGFLTGKKTLYTQGCDINDVTELVSLFAISKGLAIDKRSFDSEWHQFKALSTIQEYSRNKTVLSNTGSLCNPKLPELLATHGVESHKVIKSLGL